jgi:hypothetical protein
MRLAICYRAALIALIVLKLWSHAHAVDSVATESQASVTPVQASIQFGNALRMADLGKLDEAKDLVEAGLAAEPMSLRWHLLKADLLARQNRLSELRGTLEAAYALAPENVEVLTRLANCRDLYGADAASIYEELAQRLEAQSAPRTQVTQALERALVTGLRDGDSALAARIDQRLRILGQLEPLPPLPALSPEPASTLRVPGGIRALAVVARMPELVPPHAFLGQFADHLVHVTQGENPAGKRLVAELKEYFQVLDNLQAAARSHEDSCELPLDLEDKQSQQILRWLGWRVRERDRKLVLEVGDQLSEARQQAFASALGIDQAAMKMQLEAGRPFQLVIKSDRVSVVPDEAFWLENVASQPAASGRLLEVFLDHPPTTRLYAAFGRLTEETQRYLLQAATSEVLLNRHTDLLYAHSSAMLVQNGEMVVPGGAPALPVWEKLAGASPRQPARFIAALLSKDRGKLLAYYHLIIRLPLPTQSFLTQAPSRFQTFYDAYPFGELQSLKVHRFARSDIHFEQLLKEMPLDAQGRIDFPGGPNVWRGSKAAARKAGEGDLRGIGPLATMSSASPITQPPQRTISPAEEDEILLDLLKAEQKSKGKRGCGTEAFLTLVRFQRHRHQPIEAELASLLLERYPGYRELFPYLASLPDLGIPEITLFFQAAERLETLEGTRLNLGAGEFHSLLQWLILLSANNALQGEDLARLFAALCQGFAKAETEADFAAHCCEMVLKIVSTLQKQSRQDTQRASGSDSHDEIRSRATTATEGLLTTPRIEETLFQALAGSPRQVEFPFGNRLLRINYAAWRRQQMQEILELQSIPSLDSLLATYQSASALASGERSPGEALVQIRALLSDLQQPEQRSWQTFSQKQRKALIAPNRWDLVECLIKIEKLLDSPQAIREAATGFIGLLNPHIQVALLGWVYASYFSPRDLVLAADPWFVRRHQFPFDEFSGKKSVWHATAMRSYTTGGGTYLAGGLAQIAAAAGEVGLVGVDGGETAGRDLASSAIAARQLASLRATPWAGLDEHVLRLLALKLLLGRELLVKAALHPEVQAELADPLLSLIGLRRRAELVHALSERDLATAFRLLGSLDLYFLADWHWQRNGATGWKHSPLGQALEQETHGKGSGQVLLLGGYQPESDGCLRPHLFHQGPYEAYQGFFNKEWMAERLSPIVLDLAAAADRLNLPLGALALVSETAVHDTARRSLMANRDDWRAALQAIRSLRLEPLLDVLEGTP